MISSEWQLRAHFDKCLDVLNWLTDMQINLSTVKCRTNFKTVELELSQIYFVGIFREFVQGTPASLDPERYQKKFRENRALQLRHDL